MAVFLTRDGSCVRISDTAVAEKTQPPDAKKIFSKALAANDPMVCGPDGPCGAGPCGHLQPGTMGQSKKQSNTLNGG